MQFESQAKQLRLELQAKRGEEISVRNLAQEVQIDRRIISAVERGELDRVLFVYIRQLAEFYDQQGLDGTRLLRATTAEQVVEDRKNISTAVLIAA